MNTDVPYLLITFFERFKERVFYKMNEKLKLIVSKMNNQFWTNNMSAVQILNENPYYKECNLMFHRK